MRKGGQLGGQRYSAISRDIVTFKISEERVQNLVLRQTNLNKNSRRLGKGVAQTSAALIISQNTRLD
jgi:hypothetical protein